ncbi:MAG: acyl-ACP thioesterase [Bacteroidetes bacterium]|jgi:medium-chain acyl-[acyl-carrier-protein] hydrolase|nr:acyl-ACP thioesterase [Bacteroidota bacterium]
MSVIGKYPFQLSPQDCDFREQVSLPALGDLILQAAGKSADEKGFGMQKLNTENRTWVVSRMAIEMDRFPKWKEWINIETWVEEVGRAATTRNFRITDNNGTVIGGASTLWAMIDVTTRRAIDLQTVEGLSKAASGVPSIIEKPRHLPSVEENMLKNHEVSYSDIDFNRHANSMKYVEWMLDCFSLDWHQKHAIKRCELNFLHEVFYGDKVAIFHKHQEELSLFEIKRTDDNGICRMKLEWQ